jgi:hypothetical protein
MRKCVTYVPGIKWNLCVRKLKVRAEPAGLFQPSRDALAFAGSKRCLSKPHLTLLSPPFHLIIMQRSEHPYVDYSGYLILKMPTAFARTDNLKCHARFTKHYGYVILFQQHVAHTRT